MVSFKYESLAQNCFHCWSHPMMLTITQKPCFAPRMFYFIIVMILLVLCNYSTSFEAIGASDVYRKELETVLVVNAAVLTPDFKGGDYRIFSAIKSLKSLGYNVVYVHNAIEDGEIKHSETLTSMGVEVWGPLIPNFQFLRSHIELLKPVAVFEWLWTNGEYFSFLQALNNIIHVHSMHTAIITVVDDIIYKRIGLDTAGQPHSDRLVQGFKTLETFFWNNANVNLAISDSIKAELAAEGVYNTGILRYCQSLDTKQVPVQGPVSASRNVPTKRIGIAYMGYNNFANRKVVAWLVEMHRNVTSKYALNFDIHIFGTVEVPKSCRADVGCLYHGPQSDSVVVDAISKVKMFVAPVFTDAGISTKIIFALSCGTPVLTTEKGLSGFPAHLQQHTSPGRSHSPLIIADIDGFGESFYRAYIDDDLIRAKHSLARPYVIQHFDCQLMTADVRVAIALGRESVIANLRLRRAVTLKEAIEPSAVAVTTKGPLKVLWDIADDVNSSFSIVQKLVDGIATLKSSRVVSVGQRGCRSIATAGQHKGDKHKYSSTPHIFIRFLWPPDLVRPVCCPVQSCRFIAYLSWEMGFIPKYWLPYFQQIDAVWVPSLYSANMFLAKGSIEPHKVHVVPHGVDCAALQSDDSSGDSDSYVRKKKKKKQQQQLLRTKWGIDDPAAIVFMYVGGVTHRKGLDLLLSSWKQAFSGNISNVVLVLKVSYEHSADKISKRINIATKAKNVAKVVLVKGWMNISDVYGVADVLVQPSRAEGFGLTPLEALGAGKVVIVSDLGASVDYMSPFYANLVSSRMVKCRIYPCQRNTYCIFKNVRRPDVSNKCEELEDTPQWHEIHVARLASHMSHISKNLDMFKSRAQWGKKFLCEHFDWKTASKIAIHKMELAWSGRRSAFENNTSSSTGFVNIWRNTPEFKKAVQVFKELWNSQDLSSELEQL